MSRLRENIRQMIKFFTGGDSILPDEICQVILELSGHLRIGKRSLVYYTYFRPPFYRFITPRYRHRSVLGNKTVEE